MCPYESDGVCSAVYLQRVCGSTNVVYFISLLPALQVPLIPIHWDVQVYVVDSLEFNSKHDSASSCAEIKRKNKN